MFARLGPWCHDRRRWVVAAVDRHPRPRATASPAASARTTGRTSPFPGAESTEGFDILNAEFGGQGAGQTGTIVFQAEQGVDDPAVQSAMTALFDEVADHRRGQSRVQSPYDDGRRRSSPRTAPSPTPTSSSPRTSTSPTPPTPATPSPTDSPRSTACGWSSAATSSPSSRSPAPRRSASPSPWSSSSWRSARCWRWASPSRSPSFGIGIGGAGVILFSNVIDGARVRPVHRDHDRARRRHRLRAADHHPAPRAAPRRPRRAGVGRHRHGHRRPFGAVRRRHGRGLGARHAAHGHRLRAGPRRHGGRHRPAHGRWPRSRCSPRSSASPARTSSGPSGAGCVAATSSPSASSASASTSPRSWSGSRSPSSSLIVGFVRPGAQGGGHPPAAEAPPRDRSPTGGAGSSSTARGRRPSAAPPCCSCSPIPVLGLRLAFSDESNFADDTTTKQAYDLLVEGFGEGFNGPLYLVAEVRAGRRPRRRWRRSTPRSAPTRPSPPCSARSRTRPAPRVRWFVAPDLRAAGGGHRRARATASATTCSRRSSRPPAPTSRSPASSPPTSTPPA